MSRARDVADIAREISSSADATAKLPFFGTNFISEGYQGRFVSKLNDSVLSNVSELTGAWVSKKVGDGTTLGLHEASVNPETNNLIFFASMAIATPIHTAHHYQSFETPYLHELIGGDRNMEQTNLVVSPDGKTWDEVTRDTSYIGNGRVLATTDTAQTSHTDVLVMDEHRGTFNTLELYNKDFAIAYDRFICLKAGTYKITSNGTTNYYQNIVVNGNTIVRQDPNTAGVHSNSFSVNINLIRGDYVQKIGGNQLISGHDAECSFLIEKI